MGERYEFEKGSKVEVVKRWKGGAKVGETGIVRNANTWGSDITGHGRSTSKDFYKLKRIPKFGKGDTVICVQNSKVTQRSNTGGAGWKLGHVFKVAKITNGENPIYWEENYSQGTYEAFLELTVESVPEVSRTQKFSEGDHIRMKMDCSSASEGSLYTLTVSSDGHLYAGGHCSCQHKWEKASITEGEEKTEGECIMDRKKVIRENFEKSEDEFVVSKYLGGQITDDFLGGLVVKANKAEILVEAKRLDKEAKKCKEE